MITEIDHHVGNQLRKRRRELKLSQIELAEKLGIQYQLLQKYETAKVKLYVSHLYHISLVLNVPIDYFFEGFKPT